MADERISEFRQMQKTLEARQSLRDVGADTSELDKYMGSEANIQNDILDGALSTEQIDARRMRNQIHYDQMQGYLREDGLDSMANSLTPDGTRAMSNDKSDEIHGAISRIRTGWKNTRRDVAIAGMEAIQPDEPNVFMKALAHVIGTDAGQILMGGADIFMRSQQVLFGLLTGEDGAAWTRLFPTYVLPDLDENGNEVITSPLAEAIDLAWAKMRGDDDAIAKNRAELQAVNMASGADLIEFKDIPDAWFGEDTMDQFYENMMDNGLAGQIALGALSTFYAVGEIGLDPAIVFDFVPAAAFTAMRKGTSTVVRASRTAEIAYKSMKKLDLEEAVNAAKAHVKHTHTEHLRLRTEESANNMLNAIHHQGEVMDARNMRVNAKGEEAVDIIAFQPPGKRNPKTLAPLRTTEVTPEARTVPATKSARRLGLEADKKKGLDVDFDGADDPEGLFKFLMEDDDLQDVTFGRDAVRAEMNNHPFDDVMSAMDILADNLGIHWEPFTTAGPRNGSGVLGGVSHGQSRTVFINFGDPLIADPMTIFLHESWHQVFDRTLGTRARHRLIKGLESAGFPFKKYRSKLSQHYQDGPSRGASMKHYIGDEYIARSTSEMAMDPEFWEVLARLDPEAFEELSTSAVQMAAEGAVWMDNVGGKAPSSWLNSGKSSVVDEFGGMQKKVLDAIEEAHRNVNGLKKTEVTRVVTRMVGEIKRMKRVAKAAQRAGHETPLINKSIKDAQKYVKRLGIDGHSALVDDFKIKSESMRALEPHEIRAVRDAERKASITRTTDTFQPREIGWRDEVDLFDPEVADRLAHGADDVEHTAETLGRMVDGAELDDAVARQVNVPERSAHTGGRIVPGTKQGMIDEDALRRTLWRAKRNARAKGQTLAKYDPAMSELDKALKKNKVAGSKKIKFQNDWLPARRKKMIERMESDWFKDYQANNYDRIANGLWPKTWRLRTPAMLEPFMATRAGKWTKQGALMVRAGFMMMREPMRVLEAIDPGKSWVFLRAGMLNMENETVRLQGLFHRYMDDFGAITRRQPGKLRKLAQTDARVGPKVHEKMNELLFDILDTSPKSPKYAELTKDLTAKQRAAVANIRGEMDLLGKRLGVPGDEMIDGYMHHAFDRATYARGGNTPEHLGMSRDGNLFFAAMLKRNGKDGYIRSAVGALEVYSRGAGRKLHLEPALKKITARAKNIAKRDPKNHFFQKYVGMLVANLSGTPSLAGSLVDNVIGSIVRSSGRPYAPGTLSRKLMGVNSAIYTALLAGNRRYPVMAIATSLATTTAQYGLFRTVKGLFLSATPQGQMLFKSMNAERGWAKIFEGNGLISRMSESASRGRWTGTSIQGTENFIRGMTFWAAIDEHLAVLGYKTIEQAAEHGHLREIMFDALRSTEEVNHFFGVAGKPPMLGRVSKSGSAAATQFLSFPFKQAEQLLATGMDNPGNIGRYMNMSGILSRIAAQELGLDIREYVGFDAIEARPSMLISPMTDVLTKAALHMNQMSKIMEGRGNAEEAQRAGEDFLASLEVLVPMLGLSRSVAKSAAADAEGIEWSPTRGKIRDLDLTFMEMGPFGSRPLPTGKKGQRSEMVGMAIGMKTVQSSLHAEAQKKIRRVHVKAATARLSLVNKALQAMDSGDWDGVKRHMAKMAKMGFPIKDFTNPMKAKMELDAMSWYLMEIKNNPQLLGKTTDIFKMYGILKTEDPNAQNQ